MATYQANNYASDVYLQDTATGAITRDAEIAIRVDQSFSWDNWDGWKQSDSASFKKAIFVYGNVASGMEGKRRLGKASGPHIFVTALASSSSMSTGALASGSAVDSFLMDVPYTFVANLNSKAEYLAHALSAISQNAYNDCSRFRTNEVYANRGITGQFGRIDGYINGYAQINIQTHLGTNKPYIVENYEDVTPYVASPYPTSGFVSDALPATFGWTFAYDPTNVVGTITQAAAKFRWRPLGNTLYTETTIEGAQNTITIAPGTFTGAQVQWQVVVTSDDGIESAPSDWYTFSVTDYLSTPRTVAPVNEYVEIDKPVEFLWQHIIDSGTTQTKADLQWSEVGGAWQDLVTVNDNAQSVIIPAHVLSAGRLRWRVRTYNTEDQAGNWSAEALFIGTGTPQPPSIRSVTNKARPLVSWQSTSQAAYELEIIRNEQTVYKTGQIAGPDKTHQVTMYLANAAYTVRMRILNNALVWSAWSDFDFAIGVTPPGTPEVQAVAIGTDVYVTIFAEGMYTYLLRDGVPVADVTGLREYYDRTALGAVSYTVKTVDEDDNYADSSPATVTVSVVVPMIAAVDALDEPVLLRLTRGNPRVMQEDFSMGVVYHHYAGRKRPVAKRSGFEDERYTFPVAFLDVAERDSLISLIRRGKTLLYRDGWGNRWYCDVSTLPGERDRIAATKTVSMVLVDYIEAIEYRGV